MTDAEALEAARAFRGYSTAGPGGVVQTRSSPDGAASAEVSGGIFSELERLLGERGGQTAADIAATRAAERLAARGNNSAVGGAPVTFQTSGGLSRLPPVVNPPGPGGPPTAPGTGGVPQPPPIIGGEGTPPTPTPPPTGERGDEGTAPIITPPPGPAVQARWIPRPAADCPSLSGFRTADLYLSFNDPALLLVVTSDPQLGGVRISGGNFYNDTSTFGANGPPLPEVAQFSPCIAADSFLTLGGAQPSFPPGLEPDRLNWGEALDSIWFTQEGAIGQIDPVRFGDNRFHVWVGRFTVGGQNVDVGGALLVNWIDLVTGSARGELAPIPQCSSCWQGAVGVTTPAPLDRIELVTSTVPGGVNATATIRLSAPAPAGGAAISLVSDRPEIASVPTSIVIPAGSTSAAFTVETRPVSAVSQVRLTASAGQRSTSTTLTVAPLSVASITFAPELIRPGQSSMATVRLTAPAGEQGAQVRIVTPDPALTALATTNYFVSPGQTSISFQVRPAHVAQRTSITFLATIGVDGSRGAFGTLVIEPVLGDIDGDGVINAADQSLLLGSWGPCAPGAPCIADLNGDGVVDSQDLSILLGSWTQPGSPGTPGTPGTPGAPGTPGTPQPAVARWIVVNNSPCAALTGFRTVDLYVPLPAPGRVVLAESSETTGIRIQGGSFFQNNPGGNGPPPPDLESDPDLPPAFICWLYDSYLTIEGVLAPSSISFAVAPPANNWGSTLNATWFAFTGGLPGAEGRVDIAMFGDDRPHIRLGRFTAQQAAVVSGAVTAFVRNDATGQVAPIVYTVPPWSSALRGSLDLNGDGIVDAGDIAMLTRLIGTSDPVADLNGDGVVSVADLRILIDHIVAAAAQP